MLWTWLENQFLPVVPLLIDRRWIVRRTTGWWGSPLCHRSPSSQFQTCDRPSFYISVSLVPVMLPTKRDSADLIRLVFVCRTCVDPSASCNMDKKWPVSNFMKTIQKYPPLRCLIIDSNDKFSQPMERDYLIWHNAALVCQACPDKTWYYESHLSGVI